MATLRASSGGNMPITLANLPEYGGKVGTRPQIFIGDCGPLGGIDNLFGIKFVIDDNIGIHKKWVFPYDRFIEYGPEDEWWAIKDGFGHWEERRKPECYQRNVCGEWVYFCNPEFDKLLRDYTDKQNLIERKYEIGKNRPS